MHSLQANGTIPHPLKPADLRCLRRSRALPSIACILLERASERGAGELLGEEVRVGAGSEGGARGAEEGAGRGHIGCYVRVNLRVGAKVLIVHCGGEDKRGEEECFEVGMRFAINVG